MNWIWFSVGAVGGLLLLCAKGANRSRRNRKAEIHAPQQSVSLEERVEKALASGNTDAMISTLEKTPDPILHNTLLERIIAEYYPQRSDEDAKKVFYRYAHQHVEEIPGVLEALEKNGQERPESIDTLKMLAIALEQDGRFDEAIGICHKALFFGLQNGTKTGFEGRITRITRKRDASQKAAVST